MSAERKICAAFNRSVTDLYLRLTGLTCVEWGISTIRHSLLAVMDNMFFWHLMLCRDAKGVNSVQSSAEYLNIALQLGMRSLRWEKWNRASFRQNCIIEYRVQISDLIIRRIVSTFITSPRDFLANQFSYERIRQVTCSFLINTNFCVVAKFIISAVLYFEQPPLFTRNLHTFIYHNA